MSTLQLERACPVCASVMCSCPESITIAGTQAVHPTTSSAEQGGVRDYCCLQAQVMREMYTHVLCLLHVECTANPSLLQL